MNTRREFLGITLTSLMMGPPETSIPNLKRWWPHFPIPHEIWVAPSPSDMEEGILLESAAGLAARAALRTGKCPMIYEDVSTESYRLAFAAYCRADSPRIVKLSLDEIVVRLLKMGVARTWLLYHYDPSQLPLHDDGPYNESANVATSLAALTCGLVVSEKISARIGQLGVSSLLDLRGETEASCLERQARKFSRDVLGTCDPRARHARSLMIALGAFVCSARGETYHRALDRCSPDSPIVGWGCGPEDRQTIPSSRAGLYQTATDWCHNLTVFAGEMPGKSVSPSHLRAPAMRHWSSLDWGDGNHYSTLVMSDGDNVQWEMANFARGPEGASYYDHPRRGQIPFGWGINGPTLAQLAPRMLEDVLLRATSNDGFVLYGGAGYFYPDLYGTDPGKGNAVSLHSDRLHGYMELTGIRTLAFNFQKWDSPSALAACENMARKLPGLEGILAFQYYPYSAGKGAIRWVPGASGSVVPVASCSLCVWAKTGRPRDTTPAGVASQLNKMDRLDARSATDNCFSWVTVHAWSRFRKADSSKDLMAEERGVDQDRFTIGTERGYSPAIWTSERLASHVKLVTPGEWLMQVRLRLRPQATLAGYLAEARRAGKPGTLLAQAERLLKSADSDPLAARRCFDRLKEAWG